MNHQLKIYVPILLLAVSFLTSCKKTDNPYDVPALVNDSTAATLPVIFHIVHRGEPVGSGDNLSAASVQNYFDKLNANFRNVSGYSIDTKIQFRLAQYDRGGTILPEPGIDRVNASGYTYINDSDQHNLILINSYWPPTQYINIWVVDTYSAGSGLNKVSWTTLPVMTDNTQVCGLNHVHTSTNVIPSYADGLVLSNALFSQDLAGVGITHEMGHYFGLLHVFQYDCNSDFDCLSDTYYYNRNMYESSYQSSKPYLRPLCGGGEVEGDNYMDYYYQRKYRFTTQQVKRMRYVLSYSPMRKSEVTSTKRTSKPVIDTQGIYPDPIVLK